MDGGYRMGPFELMDLIGIDVNLEVARSFYASGPSRAGSRTRSRQRMVDRGRLGRKTGRGFYEYDDRRTARPPSGGGELDRALGRRVLERVVAQLVNEACFAAEEGVAAPADIDAAMRLGLNHPRGPFEWGRELGMRSASRRCSTRSMPMNDQRYRAAPYLRRLGGPGQPKLTADGAVGIPLRGHVDVVLARLALQALDHPRLDVVLTRLHRARLAGVEQGDNRAGRSGPPRPCG